MSDHQRARRLDQRTAERLLGGVPASSANGPAGGSANGSAAGAADGHDALRALLSAAAGPARPGELAGEDAAAAAFRAARAQSTARRSRWAAVPRYATVKVAVVAATLAAFGGGVAVAASTGHLPGQSPAPASSHHRTPKQSWHRGDRVPSPTLVPRATPPHPKPSPSPKGKPQHGRTTPPGQANNRSPKAKKTHPSKGPGNGNGSSNGSSNGKGDEHGAPKSHHGHRKAAPNAGR
jgi:hypothetical protein